MGAVQPNPWANATRIPVALPAATTVTLEVFTARGELVLRREMDLTAGVHQLEIQRRDTPGAGLYLYRIGANEEHWTGKMVVQ